MTNMPNPQEGISYNPSNVSPQPAQHKNVSPTETNQNEERAANTEIQIFNQGPNGLFKTGQNDQNSNGQNPPPITNANGEGRRQEIKKSSIFGDNQYMLRNNNIYLCCESQKFWTRLVTRFLCYCCLIKLLVNY